MSLKYTQLMGYKLWHTSRPFRKSIAFKMFMIFTIFTSFILLGTGITNQKIMLDMLEKQQVERIAEVANKSVSSMDLISLYIRQSLSSLKSSTALSAFDPNQLQKLLYATISGNGNLISSAYFIHSDGHVDGAPYGYWESAEDPIIARLMKESKIKGSFIWWTEPYISKLSGRTITFAMNVPDMPNNQLLIGEEQYKDKVSVIAVDINLYELESRISHVPDSNDVDVSIYTKDFVPIAVKSSSIWASEGQASYDQPNALLKQIWSTSKQSYEVVHHEAGDYVTMNRQVTVLGWQVVLSLNDHQFSSAAVKLKRVNLLIFLSVFMLTIGVAIYFSNYLSRPLRKLIREMQSIPQQYEPIPIPLSNRYDEIAQLLVAYNEMLLRIDRATRSLLEGEKEKKAWEMRALQAQINPHFLQNTLTTILWSVKLRKLDESENMIIALSELLQSSMDKVQSMVTVKDELALVKSYIALQHIRYPTVFTWTIEVGESVLEEEIPKLTLQPLVENAIYHGLMAIGHNGELGIHGYVSNHDVILEITDNGVGMSDTVRVKLLDLDTARKSRGLNKMGVRNVHERLQLEFGAAYGLVVNSSPSHGTTIKVRIPKQGGRHM